MVKRTSVDETATLMRVRRSLEVHPVVRGMFAVLAAVLGAVTVDRGVISWIVGVMFLIVALILFALPMFSPERARRRLLAAASERIPDADGHVTLAGVVGEAAELLTAPYSERRCVAYWARIVGPDEDDSYDELIDSEQRAASCDFALDVGEVRVLVTVGDAYLAFDRSLGEAVLFVDGATQIEPVSRAHRGQYRREEILLRPGERAVVRGMFLRGGGDAPYRGAARIVPGRGRVAIALGASASVERRQASRSKVR